MISVGGGVSPPQTLENSKPVGLHTTLLRAIRSQVSSLIRVSISLSVHLFAVGPNRDIPLEIVTLNPLLPSLFFTHVAYYGGREHGISLIVGG